MQLGMIGLGRMGGNIVRRLMKDGHSCVVYDKSADAVRGLAGEGAAPSKDLADFVKQLTAPRAVWVMLPAGQITDDDDHRTQWSARQGRHRHRRRQFLLPGRHPPRRDAEAERHPLCRCRHQRRGVGFRARLLHDDRRRQGGGRSSRPDLEDAGARNWQHRPNARAARPRSAGRAGLSPLRPGRRRAFRQDGP